MKTLIVGMGALGGVIAARLLASGATASLATRDRASADTLRASGLRVSGVGGDVGATPTSIAPVDDFLRERFDLIVLATKAHAAIELAPLLASSLTNDGTLLPIQNGGVPAMLGQQLGAERVLGGLSNLGATIHAPGVYEQRNAGHLLIGELNGGTSDRAERVRAWLGRGVEVRTTANLRGAIWSKLLLNCSVTTLGAVASCTMRQYIDTPEGRRAFYGAYDEALNVALASGVKPERMLVEPVPPDWHARSEPGEAYDAWLSTVLANYGDLKPSMLQDFERRKTTEIDFINGYVAKLGDGLNVPTPVNDAIVAMVHSIERGEMIPARGVLRNIVDSANAV
ncbi:MAG TPA: 2-dehydropantoate 2-reductase [Rudaea sp.]|jgi:2-dehydropantoate 2-reductase|nr:2-dehydropantoate 2-reductase [Rudaea sp.]